MINPRQKTRQKSGQCPLVFVDRLEVCRKEVHRRYVSRIKVLIRFLKNAILNESFFIPARSIAENLANMIVGFIFLQLTRKILIFD